MPIIRTTMLAGITALSLGLVTLASAQAQAPGQIAAPPAQSGQDEQTALSLQQIALTDTIVSQLIASFPAFKVKAEELQERYPALDASSPEAHISTLAAYPDAQAELEATIAPYGFDSIETFVRVLQSAAVAAAVLDVEEQEGMPLMEQLNVQLEQMRADTTMPEAMRSQMLSMMEAQIEQMRAMDPLPGNREAVAPYREQLRSLLEEEQ